jgi:hypothetical protein
MKHSLQVLLVCAAVMYVRSLHVIGEEEIGTMAAKRLEDERNKKSSNIRGENGRGIAPALATDQLDWGIRFNKFQIVRKGGAVSHFLPLSIDSYPLTLRSTHALRHETSAVSVIHRLDMHEYMRTEYFGLTPEYLVTASKVPLTHPSNDTASPFWADLLEVIEAQIGRVRGFPVEDWLELPETWEGYNLTTVAETVRDDFPGSLHAPLIARLLGGGTLDRTFAPNPPESAKIDRTIIPSSSSAEFLRGYVSILCLMSGYFS